MHCNNNTKTQIMTAKQVMDTARKLSKKQYINRVVHRADYEAARFINNPSTKVTETKLGKRFELNGFELLQFEEDAKYYSAY